MKRRDFMRLTAATACAALPGTGWAIQRLARDGAEVMTVSDGHLLLPDSFLFGSRDPSEFAQAAALVGGLDSARRPPCNLTLMRREGRLVLFDAGAGPAFMDSAGKLPEALDALGIAPDEVTDVIFTHAHPDHLWGAIDDFDEPVFANAAHLIGARELEFWTGAGVMDALPPDRQGFAAGAQRRVALLGDRLSAFDDGDELLPGLRAVLTPGHTPGHMSFEIALGDQVLTILGDAVGNGHMAFADPGAASPADQDPETGAATRLALMARLAESGGPVCGFHLPGGGMGRILRTPEGFRWDAETPL